MDILKTEFGQNFWASLHKILVRVCHGNSKKVKQHAANFIESLKAPSEHAGARRLDATQAQNF